LARAASSVSWDMTAASGRLGSGGRELPRRGFTVGRLVMWVFFRHPRRRFLPREARAHAGVRSAALAGRVGPVPLLR